MKTTRSKKEVKCKKKSFEFWRSKKSNAKIDKIKFDICKKLQDYSRINELSQSELAEELCVSQTQVSLILNMRIEYFKLDILLRYYLEVIPEYEIKIH